jgi:hypothetical protein
MDSVLLEPVAPPPTGRRVRIQYIDGSWRRTERVIEPLRTFRGRFGEAYLEAFCHLRGERRTFRLDRIASWVVEAVQERVSAPPPASPSPAPPAGPAASPAAPAATPARARQVRRPARRGGSALAWIGTAAIAGLIGYGLFPERPKPPARYASPVSPLPAAVAPQASSSQDPQLPRAPRTLNYRGLTIQATPVGEKAWRYAVPSLGLEARSRHAMHLAINARLFYQATGIVDDDLESRYAAADLDRDGYLGWSELEAFQARLVREFRYRANPTALRPDQFVAQGGRACEDWALMSCGLLRYWGWDCYVGRYAPAGGQEAHAVCLVRGERRPARYGYVTVDHSLAWESLAPPGEYVPVDYDVVGGLSEATGRHWRLTRLYEPEKLYGLTL